MPELISMGGKANLAARRKGVIAARANCVAWKAWLAAALLIGQAAAAAPKPDPERMSHSVTVSGRVEQALDLSVQDLKGFAPRAEIALPPRPGVNAKSAILRGVLLKDLLDKAAAIKQDHNDLKKTVVVAEATDGYAVVFSWSEIFNTAVGAGVIVFIERDGKPLDGGEGWIALISAYDTRTGPRHVKWLKAIEVRKTVD